MSEADPTPELPQHNWMRSVANGEPDAITRFFEEHVDGLYAFVYYRVGSDPALAEDVVQATFVHAIERIERFEPSRGSPLTWLCWLSRNIARRILTENKRMEELRMWQRIDASFAELFDGLQHELLVDELIERDETRDMVNIAMAHLPERYRDALQRKYVAEESLEELAAALHISAHAAKSLLARARAAFRDALAVLVAQSAAAAQEAR
ncbi:MAG: sigma-70 family RNA polymerase sigma factor [Myxococcota bacterium]|jgi:RNA polymerase sigma-70 factor (ECF subfamily)|nr:sigma-70 family RNA polymerase sigma factor [Myxococcota bacterium]